MAQYTLTKLIKVTDRNWSSWKIFVYFELTWFELWSKSELLFKEWGKRFIFPVHISLLLLFEISGSWSYHRSSFFALPGLFLYSNLIRSFAWLLQFTACYNVCMFYVKPIRRRFICSRNKFSSKFRKNDESWKLY